MKVASYSCARSFLCFAAAPGKTAPTPKAQRRAGLLMKSHEPRACSFFPVLRLLFLFLLVNIADLKARS